MAVQVERRAARCPATRARTARCPSEKANILVVDDLPEKLLVFQTVLEELGQNLVLRRSGSEALREILQREFAVILLDVNMPGIDGFETAALIRQHQPVARTRRSSSSPRTPTRCRRRRAIRSARWTTSSRRWCREILRSKVRVFVELYQMRQQVRRQADARAAVMAAQAARRVAEENDRRSAFLPMRAVRSAARCRSPSR